MRLMTPPIICPYCGSIENNGRDCFWCGNPVTEYESEENTMTIEMKFTGLVPEQAMRLLKAVAETASEAQNAALTARATVAPVAQCVPSAPTSPVSQTIPTAAPVVSPVAPPSTVPTTPVPVPTSVKQYTADELTVAARPICEAPGGREKLFDLLHSFTYTDQSGTTKQVQSLVELPSEMYPAFAAGLRQLGGRI